MPRRIKDWLKDVVVNPQYTEHIWWFDEKQHLIAIHWKHASYEDYNDQDSELFKKWAKDNYRYDPDAADLRNERKRWKTNFRCALHSATNIRQTPGKYHTAHERQSYRVYELLDRPDPHKVDKKKQSNILAAKSKQKPSNEKRFYKSRLNKSLAEPKQEPMEMEQRNVKRENRKPRVPRNTYPYRKPDVSMSTDSRLYNVTPTVIPTEHWPKEPKIEPEHLPATLELFNDEDERDGGYCSATDSSSVKSSDTGMGQQSVDFEMEPAESPGNSLQRFYSVVPLAAAAYRDSADYCMAELNNNVLHTQAPNTQLYHNQYSRLHEVSCTPNASTEVYNDQDCYMQYPGSPDVVDYCLAAL